MSIQISEFIDLGARLNELGIRDDLRMALLPMNIASAVSADDLKNASEFATLRKLLLASNVPLDDLVAVKLPTVKNKSLEWVAPSLFISGSLYSGNPQLVSLALNVVSNYIYEFFRGRRAQDEVKFEVVVEAQGKRTYKSVSYRGPVSGLKELPKAIKEAIDGD